MGEDKEGRGGEGRRGEGELEEASDLRYFFGSWEKKPVRF